MTKLLLAALAAFALLALAPAAQAETKEGKPAAGKKAEKAKLPAVPKGAKRAELAVELCCPHGCTAKVKEALGALSGVKGVYPDYEAKRVTVDYAEKAVSLRKIKDTILELGYPVDGEQPEKPHED